MSEPPQTPTDSLVEDAAALYSKALAAAESTAKYYEYRVAKSAASLEALAGGFRYAMIPVLVVATVVILVATSDRSAPLVILTLGSWVVAALMTSSLLGGFAALLRVNAAQAETLERIVAALETPRLAETAAPPAAERRAGRLAETRRAIRGHHWDEASALVHDFADAHPDDPEASRLAGELAEARTASRNELLARIEAAREVNEPDRVIELRDELKPLADADALRVLDRDLAKWFLMLIHRRLRSGTVRADVAVLAARVAGSLDETPEGASLRASLPTLRRAAGLCPRCAEPYKGLADACPACMSGVSAHAAASKFAPNPTIEEDDHDIEGVNI